LKDLFLICFEDYLIFGLFLEDCFEDYVIFGFFLCLRPDLKPYCRPSFFSFDKKIVVFALPFPYS